MLGLDHQFPTVGELHKHGARAQKARGAVKHRHAVKGVEFGVVRRAQLRGERRLRGHRLGERLLGLPAVAPRGIGVEYQ